MLLLLLLWLWLAKALRRRLHLQLRLFALFCLLQHDSLVLLHFKCGSPLR